MWLTGKCWLSFSLLCCMKTFQADPASWDMSDYMLALKFLLTICYHLRENRTLTNHSSCWLCEVGTVGKISGYQQGDPRFIPQPGRGLNFGQQFLSSHHL